MKTVADCFKYADKIGSEVGPAALAASVANKYNRQRLLRFAEICRVNQNIPVETECFCPMEYWIAALPIGN